MLCDDRYWEIEIIYIRFTVAYFECPFPFALLASIFAPFFYRIRVEKFCAMGMELAFVIKLRGLYPNVIVC